MCRDGTASTTLCMKNYRSHCHSADSQSDQQDVRLREEAGIHGDDLSRHHNHHHTYFREEWKWYEHVEQGDDFVYRNRQVGGTPVCGPACTVTLANVPPMLPVVLSDPCVTLHVCMPVSASVERLFLMGGNCVDTNDRINGQFIF